MKLFKRLLLLAVLAGIGAGALWAWQSPYYALWQIHRGLEERDPIRVERYVDLEALVRAAAEITGALAKEQIGTGGSDLGSQVLGALVGAVARQVGDAAALQGAMELRRAIQDGRVHRSVGPFVVHDGLSALGTMQRFSRTALVELKGTCQGNEASVRTVFEVRDGLTFGWPKKWVLVGVDSESLKVLARQCRKA
jgi:hypothetical protein